jgi:hypothetical protein
MRTEPGNFIRQSPGAIFSGRLGDPAQRGRGRARATMWDGRPRPSDCWKRLQNRPNSSGRPYQNDRWANALQIPRFQRRFPEKERLGVWFFGTLEFLAQGLIVF